MAMAQVAQPLPCAALTDLLNVLSCLCRRHTFPATMQRALDVMG